MGNISETQLVKGSFTLICGRTGSGKTTFLKQLKEHLGEAAGYVMQNPSNQIVCDKVRTELTFGLSNLNLSEDVIRGRIAETASFFGISRWLERDTDTLSGGEKQILNLAAIMAMNPEYLILDEPTSMLDPIMATRFIEIVLRIHRELGTTIIIAEHRPDELFGAADTVVWFENNEVIAEGTPLEIAKQMLKDETLCKLLPVATRICAQIPSFDELPLSVADGRAYLFRHPNILPESMQEDKVESERTWDEFLTLKHILFAYEKKGRQILSDCSLSVRQGEILSILGENGCGKTTLARIMAGELRPYAGTVQSKAKCKAMLCQDVSLHFLKDSYEGKHPYDYSGGEQQLLALSLVLAKKPDFLILDEPTKGLDAAEKEKLEERLKGYQNQGMTMVIITHDVAFAAAVSNRMALLFDGEIAMLKEPEDFIRDNLFYTTPKKRLLG